MVATPIKVLLDAGHRAGALTPPTAVSSPTAALQISTHTRICAQPHKQQLPQNKAHEDIYL